MTHWPQSQLQRLLPPQTSDLRGLGFATALNGLMAQKALGDFFVRDAETCPVSALPALIAEYSLEEFIEPGMPEAIVRQIVKHAWWLQEGKGYDQGLILGLSLLGMRAEVQHWHQTVPLGAPNTNRITVFAGQQLFTNQDVQLGAREVQAALRMINATKRWSQESTVSVGVKLTRPAFRVAAHLRAITVTKTQMTIVKPLQSVAASLRVAASMTAISITIKRANA